MEDKRLLVMDDDPDFCKFIQAVAEEERYKVLVVSDSSGFRNAYRNFHPDLIFLDLCMPNIDGIELLRLLKKENCRASVAIMSALEDEVIASAHLIGNLHGLDIVAAFRKPIEVSALRKLMHQTGKREFFTGQQASEGMEKNEFILHYQPIVSLHEKKVLGMEALVRWKVPHKEAVYYPEDFLYLLEQERLIKKITLWGIKHTLEQFAQAKQEFSSLIVHLNLSAKLLTDLQLPDELEQLVKVYNIDPSHICLEVNENAAMEQPLISMDILTRLRLKQFILAVDNFGVGFSSLALLQRMPFKLLKIDKSFINKIPQDPHATKLVENMISLGQGFGHKVVAEGIESRETLKALQALKCDQAQGFFIARPMLFDEFRQWLKQPSWDTG